MRIKHVCEDNYLEVDESKIKMLEESVSNCMNCPEMGTIISEKVFTVYDYLQSILSHFAKMLNYQKPVFTKEEREKIEQAENFEEKNLKDLNELRKVNEKDLQEFVDLLEKVGPDLFNTDPKVLLITKNEQRICQLEKRVEELISRIGY